MTIIIVVEPHALLRVGIVQLIGNVTPDVKIEGVDYSMLTKTPVEPRESDLVLLSVSPSHETSQLVQSAEAAYGPKSIILLADDGDMPADTKLPSTVKGYVSKTAQPELLQASIRLVLAGGTCFPLRKTDASEPIAGLKKQDMRKWQPTSQKAPKLSLQAYAESEMLGLTPRQYEVLVLLARGYPMKTVGRCLNISVATAKAHTETLYQRLDVHNRNAAVYAAVSRGAKLGWASIGGNPDIVPDS